MWPFFCRTPPLGPAGAAPAAKTQPRLFLSADYFEETCYLPKLKKLPDLKNSVDSAA
jgi:hypothetical protein